MEKITTTISAKPDEVEPMVLFNVLMKPTLLEYPTSSIFQRYDCAEKAERLTNITPRAALANIANSLGILNRIRMDLLEDSNIRCAFSIRPPNFNGSSEQTNEVDCYITFDREFESSRIIEDTVTFLKTMWSAVQEGCKEIRSGNKDGGPVLRERVLGNILPFLRELVKKADEMSAQSHIEASMKLLKDSMGNDESSDVSADKRGAPLVAGELGPSRFMDDYQPPPNNPLLYDAVACSGWRENTPLNNYFEVLPSMSALLQSEENPIDIDARAPSQDPMLLEDAVKFLAKLHYRVASARGAILSGDLLDIFRSLRSADICTWDSHTHAIISRRLMANVAYWLNKKGHGHSDFLRAWALLYDPLTLLARCLYELERPFWERGKEMIRASRWFASCRLNVAVVPPLHSIPKIIENPFRDGHSDWKSTTDSSAAFEEFANILSNDGPHQTMHPESRLLLHLHLLAVENQGTDWSRGPYSNISFSHKPCRGCIALLDAYRSCYHNWKIDSKNQEPCPCFAPVGFNRGGMIIDELPTAEGRHRDVPFCILPEQAEEVLYNVPRFKMKFAQYVREYIERQPEESKGIEEEI
ncbi:hypothetical protein BXZ70DRAFT_1078144 [Cristinia sonorae]|uniref:Uncharacterized protein n=1 Tax=Cristinia sonorae TaxID=1940300 RepID=A0A8K0XP26_9AGAR|nr:hypothetical protein BXZ70DRAFT_1078144 [Cristinia sonorae]